MTKHTPAMPLPWKASGHRVEPSVAVCSGTREKDAPATAAYIAHAANAYPKLVAAIQDDLRGYLGDFPTDHPATKLRDLLRDLGEEA